MAFRDLREFIGKVRELDKVLDIDKAHWDLEVGALTEITAKSQESPALLFDNIGDYPRGYRVLTNFLSTPRKAAMALNMPLDAKPVELTKLWKERIKSITPVPPREVSDGPVLENVLEGQDVDCMRFPAPKWHERDGGRYLGTADIVIQRDLDDSNWTNLGTYRVQLQSKDVLSLFIVPGHHGMTIARKYWSRGIPCPVAMVFGLEPAVWIAATHTVPQGMSELGYAGWMRGEAVEVIRGEKTGLPIPATAEIAVEGDLFSPEETGLLEGPFGEWPGYYASAAERQPIVKVKRIMFRNDPIILGAPPLKPLATHTPDIALDFGSARLWQYLEAAGVPDVCGVSRYIAGQNYAFFFVISIRQRYAGHARQAAHAALGSYTGAGLGRFIIVVDDDVDPANIHEVLWAVGTRCDPASSIDILKGCLSSPLDPRIEPEKRAQGNWTSSKAIIDACRPFHWRNDFPPVNEISESLKAKVLERWGPILGR